MRHAAGPRLLFVAGLWLVAGLLFMRSAAMLAPDTWLTSIFVPAPGHIGALLLHDSALPRLLVCLLCGACLGLSGVLFQSVLRNPLAEPATLGVFAGAQVALTAGKLWAPGLLAIAGTWSIAFAGAALAMIAVLALAARRKLTPTALILAGLVVTIYLGGINAMLALFHHDVLTDLFLWQTGSMQQNDWSGVAGLLPLLMLAAALAWLLSRPIRILSLGDDSAAALGVPVVVTRLAAIAIAVLLAAGVAASVGVVAFIGLIGPLLARLSGGGARLPLWSALYGAGLLALADQTAQVLPFGPTLPTGTLTAALGAPLLLVMMRRLPPAPLSMRDSALSVRVIPRPGIVLLVLTAFLAASIVVSLTVGRIPSGWHWGDITALDYLPWRLPRTLAALSAGAAFGIAGTLIQRLTGNVMTSPEILGISSGAAIGLIAAVMVLPQVDRVTLHAATAGGALLVLLATLWLARRARFSPETLILTGIGLVTLFSALSSLLLISGNPRATMLLSWLAGSTYRASIGDAAFAGGIVLAVLASTPLMARWLTILPLGEATASALGVPIARARLTIIIGAALTTAAGTLIVGPLSFIGLMAPHIARFLGLRGAAAQILGAVLAGAALTVFADWAGRNIVFPWQIPAGLASTFIGGTYLLARMGRR